MTDTRKAALSMALDYWRHRADRVYTAISLHQPPPRPSEIYSPAEVVSTAEIFTAFLDGEKPKKRSRG